MRPDRAGRAPLLDEYIVLQEGANDHRIRAIIEFDGRIEEDRLRAALLASFAIVPLLGAAYVRRRGHGRWEGPKGDEATSLERCFRILKAPDADAAAAALESSLAWIPDQSTGPQLGLSLLRGKDHDTICLVVNHAVMDGRGFKDYLALLARLYNGEGDGDMGRGRRDLYGALKSYRGTGPSAGSRPAGPRSLRAGPRTRSALLMPPSASEPRGRARLFRWQGSLAALDSLRARPEETLAAARALPATINDLLIAAAAAAIARALPLDRGQPIEVAFMVDMRRYDREAMLSPYCNASSTESLWIDPWNRELGELIADIAGQTAAIKEGQPGLRGLRQLKAARRFLPRPLFEAVLKRRIRASTLATTNLGHLDPAALRFGGAAAVDAFVVTALKEDPALQFSLSTFGEKLTITSYGSWSAENEAKVAAIFDSLSSILAPP